MHMNTFSIGDNVRFGWGTFKKRSWFFIGALLLYIVAVSIVSAVLGELGKIGPAIAFVSALGSWIVQTLASMGLIAFLLKAHDNPESVSFMDFWHPQTLLNYLGASILVGILVFVGFVLLIVPGVIAMLMLIFTLYLVIDRNMGPIVAMKESARITKGYRMKLLGLVLTMVGLNIVGLLCLVVGLLVSMPVSMLALVHAYRTLEHHANEMAPTTGSSA